MGLYVGLVWYFSRRVVRWFRLEVLRWLSRIEAYAMERDAQGDRRPITDMTGMHGRPLFRVNLILGITDMVRFASGGGITWIQ